MMHAPLSARRICAAILLSTMAGCATLSPPAPTEPAVPVVPPPKVPAPYVEPPPPPVNLQGFPPAYRLGFGDGCATGRGSEKKDPMRFSNDGNYRVGWQDGLAQCRKQ